MTWDEARDEIIRRTERDSPHQRAAFELLMAFRAQGYVGKRVTIVCSECHHSVPCVRWTDKGVIVDTWGYIEGDKDVCYKCLHEGYIGDIFLPIQKPNA